MYKKLFIPGPVSVREEVLQMMATPMIGHRGKDASKLQKEITEKLQVIFNTKDIILLSTSSGSGLMEGAIRSCTKKRAAVFSVGAFGKRWHEMAIANQVPADLFEVEWGQATDPLEVDKVLSTGDYDLVTITHNETSTGIMNPIADIAEVVNKYKDVVFCVDAVSSFAGADIDVSTLGIDICIASTQKALGLPPGMAICNFSPKAIERAKQVPNRGMYLDLLALYDYIITKDHQYPSTPSLSLMFALNYQLDAILQEGPKNRFKRHEDMAEVVRKWAKDNFALFADERYLSNTLTVITNNKEIDIAKLNSKLGERGYQIANGYGKMKDKTFRIAHMADCTEQEIHDLLSNINEIIKQQ